MFILCVSVLLLFLQDLSAQSRKLNENKAAEEVVRTVYPFALLANYSFGCCCIVTCATQGFADAMTAAAQRIDTAKMQQVFYCLYLMLSLIFCRRR